MDFITDLPLVKGFDSILVVVDQGLSKGVILIPCNKTITAEGTAKLLLNNLYKRFGLPGKIISDRDPRFAKFVSFLPLTVVIDNILMPSQSLFQLEIASRFNLIIEGYNLILDDLYCMRLALEAGEMPFFPFDPMKMFGKYE
jgi:hypothetical protein